MATERFKPKRRNISAKSKHDCINCDLYQTIPDLPCLFKLEAAIDSMVQKGLFALKLIRKTTAYRRGQTNLLQKDG